MISSLLLTVDLKRSLFDLLCRCIYTVYRKRSIPVYQSLRDSTKSLRMSDYVVVIYLGSHLRKDQILSLRLAVLHTDARDDSRDVVIHLGSWSYVVTKDDYSINIFICAHTHSHSLYNTLVRRYVSIGRTLFVTYTFWFILCRYDVYTSSS